MRTVVLVAVVLVLAICFVQALSQADEEEAQEDVRDIRKGKLTKYGKNGYPTKHKTKKTKNGTKYTCGSHRPGPTSLSSSTHVPRPTKPTKGLVKPTKRPTKPTKGLIKPTKGTTKPTKGPTKRPTKPTKGPKKYKKCKTKLAKLGYKTISPTNIPKNASTSTPPRNLVNLACSVQKIKPFISRKRIIKGIPAKPGSWPWMVQLGFAFKGDPVSAEPHFCGGVLIDHQYVLTAAHCVNKRFLGSWDVALTLGQHDVSKTDPFEQNFTIESFYVHEKFDPATQDNDLTIIKLNKPARLSSHVGPICMPPAKHEWQDGSECMTIGWGYDGGGKPVETNELLPPPWELAYSTVLQQVSLPLITTKTCLKHFYNTSFLTDNMVCAGFRAGGKDACRWDSGGPLMCKHQEKWILAGITSKGIGCGWPRQPGVYTKIGNYRDWITQKMEMMRVETLHEARR